jgi:hypothetical protein
MEQLAATLLTWIALHSSYPVANAPVPKIVVLSPTEMTARYRQLIDSNQREPAIDPRVLGHFERQRGRRGIVYIVDPTVAPGADRFESPLLNPVFRERLLHELIHYAQHFTGAYEKFECAAKAEFDAYMLGGRYLADKGAPDDFDVRIRMAYSFSRC